MCDTRKDFSKYFRNECDVALRNFRGTRGRIFMCARKDIMIQNISKRMDTKLTCYFILPHNGHKLNISGNRKKEDIKRNQGRKSTNSIIITSK